MKSNWEKDIHDRLGNFEQDAPEGLWAAINKKMAEGEDGFIHAGKPVRFYTLRRTASVAAAASVALILGYTFLGHDNNQKDISKRPSITAFVKHDSKDHSILSQGMSTLLTESVLSSNIKMNGKGIILQTIASIDNDTSDMKTINNIADSDNKIITSEKDENKRERESDNLCKHTHEPVLPHTLETTSRSVRTSRWTVSASTTGAVGAEKTTTNIGVPIVAVSLDAPKWQNDPMLGIALFNQGKEVTKQYKHHLPIRLGVKVAYALNKRFSMESGLTYTRLSSDIKSGSEDNYFTGEQKLNYLGIPVGVRYNVLEFNHFSLYGTTNALLEKCVSGTVTNNYVINNTPTQTDTHPINSKPLQLSVGASVGVQFNVVDNIDIYAEPGVSYHFDDHSSIQTIYKEKPLNFDLSIGIRYTINK